MPIDKTLAMLLLAAALLPGCGGGEEPDDILTAQDTDSADSGPPSRGPEWLQPPPQEIVLAAP
jgi:hypothetical protein